MLNQRISVRIMATWLEIIKALPEFVQGWYSAGSNSVHILVTGKTGVGKSSLINGLVGKEVAKEGDELDPETMEVTAHSFKYQDVDITIWDSPGLQDGLNKEGQYIRDMQNKGCANADLYLYCIKMNETRMREEDIGAIRKLTKGLGNGIWKNAVFVLTFANEVNPKPQRGSAKKTEKEEKKRKKEHFKKRLEEWKTKICEALTKAGVDPKVASKITVVPAGYDYDQQLPDRGNWLSPLWYASILRMKERSQPALLKANLHRIKLPDQVTPADFDKPLHEQPIIFKHIPPALTYTAIPTVCAAIGGILGVVAGPAGAAIGGAAGAGVGGIVDGVIAYYTSGSDESDETTTAATTESN